MKKTLLPVMALAMLTACEHIELADDTQTEAATEHTKRKDVMFVMKGITEEYSTRATMQSVGLTDLWIRDGYTLIAHKTSTDDDFGTPTVSLTYGAHDLTFVASKAEGQSVDDNGLWNCTKVKDTFAKAMSVTVSGGSSSSRQVELTRRSSQMQFTIQDAIPADVKTIHITVDNHLSLDDELVGCGKSTYDASLDVSSRAGTTGLSPVINIMTASPVDEEDVSVMIEFLGSNGTALYHYDRTVKVKPNRCTNLTGNYFQGDANQVSVQSDWDTQLDVNL